MGLAMEHLLTYALIMEHGETYLYILKICIQTYVLNTAVWSPSLSSGV